MAEKKVTTEAPTAPKVTKKAYVSKFRIYHPWQDVYINTDPPVKLVMDSYLQAQIDAGIVTEVDFE